MEGDKETPTKEYAGTPTGSSFQIPQHVLDDLCSRFIINIPEEERQDLIRVFFQIELALWFYLDFYVQEKPELKGIGIKDFAAQIFKHCPTLSDHSKNVEIILGSWREYKMAVPTYGGILLDPSMQYCVLVQGYWSKSSWGFPKGKVNESEDPHICAVREVYEETGYDIAPLISPRDYIEYRMNEQLNRLYIIPDVSMKTKFQPRTRKEIKNLEWFKIEFLPAHKKDFICKTHFGLNPNSFFMVIPFIKNLRKWIVKKQQHTENFDLDVSIPSTQRGGGKHKSKDKDTDGKNASDKQRQKQNILNSYLKKEKEESSKEKAAWVPKGGKDGRHKSESPQAAGPKMLKGSKVTSPDMRKKSKQYQILKRDGTVAGTPTRRSLASEFSDVKPQTANGEFTSITWTNFKLDIDSLMACCP